MVSLGVPLVQGYYLACPAPPWAGIDLDLGCMYEMADGRPGLVYTVDWDGAPVADVRAVSPPQPCRPAWPAAVRSPRQ